MRTRLIFAISCMFFLSVGSTAMAVESDKAPASAETVGAIGAIGDVDDASEVSKDPKLQKWLQGIKPAAGVNYWEKKVVRRSGRKMVTGKE